MSLEIIWDCETDGFLEEATVVHLITLTRDGGDTIEAYHDGDFEPRDGSLIAGVMWLEKADKRIAHNGERFDEKILRKKKVLPKRDKAVITPFNSAAPVCNLRERSRTEILPALAMTFFALRSVSLSLFASTVLTRYRPTESE